MDKTGYPAIKTGRPPGILRPIRGAHKEVRYGKSAKITAPTVWLRRMSRSSTPCLRKRSHSEDTRWESFLRAMPHRENAGEAGVQVRPVEQCVETFGVRG